MAITSWISGASWLFLILGVASNALASVLIKVAADGAKLTLAQPLALLSNAYLVLGLFFYGATFLFYLLALTKLPLNVVHPVLTSGAIVCVAFASAFFFKETFYTTTIIGIGLIIIGVILVTIKVG